jgi:hypothetical protein
MSFNLLLAITIYEHKDLWLQQLYFNEEEGHCSVVVLQSRWYCCVSHIWFHFRWLRCRQPRRRGRRCPHHRHQRLAASRGLTWAGANCLSSDALSSAEVMFNLVIWLGFVLLLSAGFVLSMIHWMHDNGLWFLVCLLPCLVDLLVYI